MTAASRAWWMLRWAGHGQVRVLNGGLRAWTAAGYEVERGPRAHEWGDFTVSPGGMTLLTAEDAASVARTGLLLDARAPERYRGDVEPYDPVAGHIPGAVNAPADYNLNEHGLLVPRERLRDRFHALGADRASEVGVYCGSGVRAAQQVLALERAGISAGLYIGSWSNWITDPTRPIATGSAAGS
ncbi:sulfurtransferase [Streptomyces actinomycinicus]